MRIALCNEVIAPMPFPAQCEYAAKLGYDGLELAPYTLSEEPHRMGAAQIAATRSAAACTGCSSSPRGSRSARATTRCAGARST